MNENTTETEAKEPEKNEIKISILRGYRTELESTIPVGFDMTNEQMLSLMERAIKGILNPGK